MTITINIQEDTWKLLNQKKEAGETFDSVINKALSAKPIKKEKNK